MSRRTAQAGPMAGGRPIAAAVADAAAEWLTLLMSGDASEHDRQRWLSWRQADPEHERAWRHIEAVTARLGGLQPAAAYHSLADAARSPGRRRAMKSLLWVGVAGAGGLLLTRTPVGRQALADYRTGTGEQRQWQLEDGSRVMLNTASAMDVRMDPSLRQLRLLRGEAYLVTGHGAAGRPERRPFLVTTPAGDVQALGTRFLVRCDGARTEVAVLEGAVRLSPARAAEASRVLEAGQRARFATDAVGPVVPVDAQAAAWTQGQIVADEIRLGDFVADLARYRHGILRCDPAVADLRVSGVFPLRDTDRILRSLPRVLPVRLRSRTRYWVMVEPAR